jgi:hypothetical protein
MSIVVQTKVLCFGFGFRGTIPTKLGNPMKHIAEVLVCVWLLQGISTCVTKLDGNALMSDCKAAMASADDEAVPLTAKGAYCLGFVNGIMLTLGEASFTQDMNAPNPSRAVCFPKDVGMTTGQATRVVQKYLESHPEKLHEGAHILVIHALSEAFPCK